MKEKKHAERGPAGLREAKRSSEERPDRGPEEPREDLRGSGIPWEVQGGRDKSKDGVKVQERVGTGGGHGQNCAETGVLSTFWRGAK